ncbi:hypothetical protein K1F50_00140 [Muricauda oceani]|uniref:Outer membrane protein beta-barrel domain-containing protein n=1 Tax=Flagellimonas oceani TaxID=2698672 RepID=A0A6G7J212_9FLAO|nr:hypothetical protein [Allomuricauda oceani]MBW8241186.1 hypothetical protein [Allomuricauda oceani]QII44806.1 hypothetical protein GVT53_08965 [Allomuricauda oceani]
MYRLLFPFMMCGFLGLSQSIDLDRLGKAKLFDYSGSLSANGVFYEGTANRQAFTYFVNGNLNFNIAEVYNVPLSFAYTNQNFDFSSPFKLNRLSISPSYKWITAHIGDVAMSFSPYTLSGHQFTGVGIDLVPPGPFKVSAMYGRFLRAVEYNIDKPNQQTAYLRRGFGLKSSYAFEKFNLGLIFFKGFDDKNSLHEPFPVELGLSPKDNTAVSFLTDFQVKEKINIRMEYAVSGITEDVRVTDKSGDSGMLSLFLNENITTQYTNAFNASIGYSLGNGTLGGAYERVDPNYRTFGAYYFNNDLENITVNASQTIFDNKLNIGVNAGLQRDNLDDSKASAMKRLVSAINLNYAPTERLGINGSFSNFQSYTNIRDQFDYINQVNGLDNLDTLNYRQISKNANLSVNYTVKQTETRTDRANINVVYQDSNEEQEGAAIENSGTRFYNGSASYALGYPQQSLTITVAANTSYTKTGEMDAGLTLGPTLGVAKQFFDKKLRSNFSASYNTSFANGAQQNQFYNLRLGGNYAWKEGHNFSLNILSLFRNTVQASTTDFTTTFGYTYTFGRGKKNNVDRPPSSFGQSPPQNNLLTFRYRDVVYSGTPSEIKQQLQNVLQQSRYDPMPQEKRDELEQMLMDFEKDNNTDRLKDVAIAFLKELHRFEELNKTKE